MAEASLSKSRTDEFVIRNGVLERYYGSGEEVVIPDGVTSIGKEAFIRNEKLKKVVCPEGVRRIGEGAFRWCDCLTTVSLPGSVTVIGAYAFEKCNNLENISIPEGVTYIGEQAFFGCDKLADINGFIIIKGILFGCLVGDKEIILPEEITRIDQEAFDQCPKLTGITLPKTLKSIGRRAFWGLRDLTVLRLPDSITNIERGAFEDCQQLKKVTLPDGLTSIEAEAFAGCSSLEDINLPEGLISIGDEAFCRCYRLKDVKFPESLKVIGRDAFKASFEVSSTGLPKGLISINGDVKPDIIEGQSSSNDPFIMVNGSLIGYTGSERHVVIPDGVTLIGNGVFQGHAELNSAIVPDSVTYITDNAFSDCPNLQLISLPETMREHISIMDMPNLNTALLVRGEEKPAFYVSNLLNYEWGSFDSHLINNGPYRKNKLPVRLLGALGRLLEPVVLSEEYYRLYQELLTKNAKKLVTLAEATHCPEILRGLLSVNILDEKAVKAIRKLMAASAVPEIAILADAEISGPAGERSVLQTDAPQSPLQMEYTAKYKAINGDKVLKKVRLLGVEFQDVLLKDGSKAPRELFLFILASYGGQILNGKYIIDHEADAAAALLRYDSLCEVMNQMVWNLRSDAKKYQAYIPFLCRYGNAEQFLLMLNHSHLWDWHRKDILEYAMPLSDTREAVVQLEKRGGVSQFSDLRGITEEEVYERYLFDFGFDENSKRVFNLKTKTIEAVLTPELTITLYDTEKKKTIKTLPKKGVDPGIYEQAASELDDIKRTLKKAVKIEKERLFADYLEGTAVPSEQWKQSFLKNPFLERIAELLVWAQGSESFVLANGKAVDSSGCPYVITGNPVRIAHAMEMDESVTAAWQKYFTKTKLKQPFLQVWEPVYRSEDIREDRYSGSSINPYYFKDQQRRGIHADWYDGDFVSRREFSIKGFQVEAKDAEPQSGNDRVYINIISIKPIEWNRRTNMILSFLDRITIRDRIKKDDMSVMEGIGQFTLPQVKEFITGAQEANAISVLTALLEYTNNRFSDKDPMDELTLDW